MAIYLGNTQLLANKFQIGAIEVKSYLGSTLVYPPGLVLWTPAELITETWYDAADAATLTTTGGLVDEWRDKSGNLRHLTGPNGAKPTLSGSNVVFSSANTTRLTANLVNLLQPVSIFMITDPSGANTDNQYIFDCTPRIILGENTNQGFGMFAGNWVRSVDLSPINQSVHAAIVNGASSFYKINGTQVLSGDSGANNSASGTITLGRHNNSASQHYNGTISEFILISGRTVSSLDIEKIEGYLAHKWGLTASLPLAHPYKTAAPTV